MKLARRRRILLKNERRERRITHSSCKKRERDTRGALQKEFAAVKINTPEFPIAFLQGGALVVPGAEWEIYRPCQAPSRRAARRQIQSVVHLRQAPGSFLPQIPATTRGSRCSS